MVSVWDRPDREYDRLDVVAGMPDQPVTRRKAAHRFDDIHYSPGDGPCTAICTCGARFRAETPDALHVKWVAHGGQGSV